MIDHKNRVRQTTFSIQKTKSTHALFSYFDNFYLPVRTFSTQTFKILWTPITKKYSVESESLEANKHAYKYQSHDEKLCSTDDVK